MIRKDKYGRGSAAANGAGFVDLAPGDTFAALEAQLKQRIADRFDNPALGISASIGSKRNASELAKHLASGEEEESHKFAAKNIGVLFARGQLGILHDAKKAVVGQRWITRFIRVFTPFRFAGDGYLATLTLKDVDPDKRMYAVEAVEINQDAKSRSTPRGAISKDLNSAPFQDLTSQLPDMVSYYVGDVNRTHPKFIGRPESFSVNRTVELLENLMSSVTNPQSPTTIHQSPIFSIIIPVYNVVPYLRECLDSVHAQSYDSWEAICIDDGSTDESGSILDEYAEKDGRFRVIHQQNAGVSVARNAGLDVACGTWILFLDSDDCVSSSTLEGCAQAISKCNDIDFVSFALQRFEENKKWTNDGGQFDGELRDLSQRLDADIIQTDFCTGAYRRSVVAKTRFHPDIKYGEDRIFFGEVLSRMRRAFALKNVYYGYRQRRGSATHSSMTAKFVLDTMMCWSTRAKFLLQDERLVSYMRLRQYLQLTTEVFARQYYSLPKSERVGLYAKWLKAVDGLVAFRSKMPWWNSFVICFCAAIRHQWALRLLCYLPDKLKLWGLHR